MNQYEIFCGEINFFLADAESRQSGSKIEIGTCFRTGVLSNSRFLPRLFLTDPDLAKRLEKQLLLLQHQPLITGQSGTVGQHKRTVFGILSFSACCSFWKNKRVLKLWERVNNGFRSAEKQDLASLVKNYYRFLSLSKNRPFSTDRPLFANSDERAKFTVHDTLVEWLPEELGKYNRQRSLYDRLNRVFWGRELMAISLLVDKSSNKGHPVPFCLSIWERSDETKLNIFNDKETVFSPKERLILGTPGVDEGMKTAILTGIEKAYNGFIDEKFALQRKEIKTPKDLIEFEAFIKDYRFDGKEGFQGLIFIRFVFGFGELPENLTGSSITAAAYLLAYVYFKFGISDGNIRSLSRFTERVAITGSYPNDPFVGSFPSKLKAFDSNLDGEVNYKFAPKENLGKMTKADGLDDVVSFEDFQELQEMIDAAYRHWKDNAGDTYGFPEYWSKNRSMMNYQLQIEAITGIFKNKNASKVYYDKLQGKTLKPLIISPLLLPDVTSDEDYAWGPRKETNEGNHHALIEIVETARTEENRHCAITGEGGMGKTVSLLNLWKHYLDDQRTISPIPFYLSLDRFNNGDYDNRFNWILQEILRVYGGKALRSLDEQEAVYKELDSVFDNKIPKLVLLLDGLNEVTVDRHLLMGHIGKLLDSHGVQIILTSRSEHTLMHVRSDLIGCRLLPLDRESIKTYGGKYGIQVPENQRILELLSNPMMLCLYCSTEPLLKTGSGKSHDYSFKSDVSTQGELLWNFVAALALKNTKQVHQYIIDPLLFQFYIEILLPRLGMEMELEGQFGIDFIRFGEISKTVLLPFVTHEPFSAHPSLLSLSKHPRFDHLDTKGVTNKLVGSMLEDLTDQLGLLVEDKKHFRFRHQHFRDFFAAAFIQSRMEWAQKKSNLPEPLINRTLPEYLLRLLGEINGDHQAVPTLNNGRRSLIGIDKTLSDHLLDVIREKSDEDIGYTLWNVIEMLKIVRQDLSTVNFSNLNLSGVYLGDVRLGYDNENGPACRFDNAVLAEKTLFPLKHESFLKGVYLLDDNSRFITLDSEGISLWDTETGRHVKRVLNQPIHRHHMLPDRKRIITVNNDGTQLLCAMSGQKLKTYPFIGKPTFPTLISGSKWMVFFQEKNNGITVVDYETSEKISHWQVPYKADTTSVFDKDRHIHVTPNGLLYILVIANDDSEQRLIDVWDCKTGGHRYTIPIHNPPKSWSVSPDDRFIAVCEANKVRIWNRKEKVFYILCDFSAEASETGERVIWDLKYVAEDRLFVSFNNGLAYYQIEDRKNWKNHLMLNGSTLTSQHSSGSTLFTREINGTFSLRKAQTGEIVANYNCGESKSLAYYDHITDYRMLITYHIISDIEHTKLVLWRSESNRFFRMIPLNRLHYGYYSERSLLIRQSDGAQISVFAERYGTIRLWDDSQRMFVKTRYFKHGTISAVNLSKDMQKIAVGNTKGHVFLWDLKFDNIYTIKNNESPLVTAVCFSPDGKELAVASEDGSISFWDCGSDQIFPAWENRPTWSALLDIDGRTPVRRFILERSHDEMTYTSTGDSVICAITEKSHKRDESQISVWQVSRSSTSKLFQVPQPLGHSKNAVFVSRDNKSIFLETESEGLFQNCYLFNLRTQGLIEHTHLFENLFFNPQYYSGDRYDPVYGRFTYTENLDATILQFLDLLKKELKTSKQKKKIDMGVYRGLFKEITRKLIFTPDLCVHGCDFTGIHPDSQLSADAKAKLKQYGAKV